jgi:hypothetical protein
MQAGSLVKCVGHIKPSDTMMAVIFTPPKCGEVYEVEDVMRCICNKHNNLHLVGVQGHWHEKNFKEVQPPMDLSDLLKERAPEKCPVHVEELEFEEV